MSEAAERTGWFWQMRDGRMPQPPAMATLGVQEALVDPAAGTAEVVFQPGDHLLNTLGTVQGGFLAAMLDTALSSALLCTMPHDAVVPTLELKVSYLRPAQPGRLTVHGRVLHRGGRIGFLEGDVRDEEGTLLATGSATVKIVERR